MNIFESVFNLAIFLFAAWFIVPIVFSLVVMFLPFIGAAIAILIVIAMVIR